MDAPNVDAVPPNNEEPVLAGVDPKALVVLLPNVLPVLPKSPPVLAVLALLLPNIEDPPKAVLVVGLKFQNVNYHCIEMT